jgi:hypothetical protein
MKKHNFGLQTRKWSTLIEASSSIMDTAPGTAPTPRHARSILKSIMPGILATIQRNEHRDQTLVQTLVLADMEGMPLDNAMRQCVLETTQVVVEAMDRIHALLHPLAGPLPRAKLPPVEIRGDHSALRSRLERVVQLVTDFAEGDVLGPYLRKQAPRQNVRQFQLSAFQLCGQATYAKLHWSVDLLRERMALAMNMTCLLVREVTRCHGFLEELWTQSSQGTPGSVPPILTAMCRRAMLNFTAAAHDLLKQVSPEAVPAVCGDEEIPRFHHFRLDNLVKYQALLFDTSSGSADMGCLSKDLLLVAHIFHETAQKKPYSLFVKHTSVTNTLNHIYAAFPDRDRVLDAPMPSQAVLEKANTFAAPGAPLQALSEVYTRLIRRLAKEAICTQKAFLLDDVLAYFRAFYKAVNPPVYNSGILAMRVYQVYRDTAIILGLSVEASLPEKAFFSDISETLVPDPLGWAPTPLASRAVAQGVSMCRDLILTYTQASQLPDKWVDRLVVFLAGERAYSKDEVLEEYERIQALLAGSC